MYKIGEMSKLCGLPVKTLRYYDQLGLLAPDRIDPFTGYRYYSASKTGVCYKIIALKELGFSLDEIKKQLDACSGEEVLGLIDVQTEKLKNSIRMAESRLRRIEEMKAFITEGDSKMYDFVITSAEGIRAAYIRDVFKTKQAAQKALSALADSLPSGIVGKRRLIINHETEYKESDLDLAVCVEITGKLPPDLGAEERHIGFGGETASVICDPDDTGRAYAFIEKQINELPAQIVGAFYEIMYDDGTVELKVPVCRLSDGRVRGDDEPFADFENDPEMIGKWHFLDCVPCREQFLYGHPKFSDDQGDIWLKDIYFMPGGLSSWIISGWTKGAFMTRFNYPAHTYRHGLSIEQTGGKTLMFVEMKDDYERISHGGRPEIYVYEKVSDRVFDQDEIGIKDEVNYPYIEDTEVLGTWNTVGFTQRPEDFDPSDKKEYDLFVRGIEFQPEGRAVYRFNRENAPFYSLEWTKGMLLDKRQLTNSAYELKKAGGREYLFVQWKTGDYIFGGRKPSYYVFERQI